MMFIRVDFPDPDAPIIATNSPHSMVRPIPRRFWISMILPVMTELSARLATSCRCRLTNAVHTALETRHSRRSAARGAGRGVVSGFYLIGHDQLAGLNLATAYLDIGAVI